MAIKIQVPSVLSDEIVLRRTLTELSTTVSNQPTKAELIAVSNKLDRLIAKLELNKLI